jgi:hypothetical protein
VIAVIRHPFDVIQSWRSLGKVRAIANGKLPQAAKYWSEIGRIAMEEGDELDRMIQIYDAFCQRYFELREHIEIVRFEDLRENPMMASDMFGIKKLSPAAALIENRPRILLREDTNVLKQKFKRFGTHTKEFYDL